MRKCVYPPFILFESSLTRLWSRISSFLFLFANYTSIFVLFVIVHNDDTWRFGSFKHTFLHTMLCYTTICHLFVAIRLSKNLKAKKETAVKYQHLDIIFNFNLFELYFWNGIANNKTNQHETVVLQGILFWFRLLSK